MSGLERNYPITPRPADDSRFAMGMVLDVVTVLVEHGYATPTATDVVELRQHLFRFLYGSSGRPGEQLQAAIDLTAELAGEVDELRAQRAAVLALHPREVNQVRDTEYEHFTCGVCLDAYEDLIPWPCPTARALGVTE